MSNQDREKRQEFEAAMRALPCPIHWTFESDGCDGYHMMATDWAFIGWQAALSAGQATEPVAWVNRDELDNMLDDREATIQGQMSGWRKTPLFLCCDAEWQDGWKTGHAIGKGQAERAAGLVIPEPPTADALDAKRYRFLRDQYEGRSYTTDSGPRPSTPESRVAYAIKNFGERTLDMIEIHLLCHHLGPREEPFWTPGDHFDYGRNMDAALDAAMLLAAPTLGDQG